MKLFIITSTAHLYAAVRANPQRSDCSILQQQTLRSIVTHSSSVFERHAETSGLLYLRKLSGASQFGNQCYTSMVLESLFKNSILGEHLAIL